MKKLFVVLFGFTFVIGLSACDFIPTENNDDTNLAPVISCEDFYNVEVGDESFSLDDLISISDEEDGIIPLHSSMIDYKDFDINILGSYDVLILVSDSSGASINKLVTINVNDTILPEIELLGLNITSIIVGSEYVELGATLTDNYDLELELTILGEVNQHVVGQYTLEYFTEDSSGNKSESVYRTVSVTATLPVVTISNEQSTQDTITFDLTVTDNDSVGEITAIELYQGETLVESLADLSVREFTGLLSNTLYSVEVIYTYDLNDGLGDQTKTFKSGVETIIYQTPVATISNEQSTQDTITFDITVTDTDNLGEITAIELYQGETLVESLADLSVREFTGLLSNTLYSVEIIYTYDLNDGLGDQTLTFESGVETIVYQTPVVTISNEQSTQDTITFDLTVTDNDLVGEITAIELFLGETLVESLADLSVREFTGLLSNTVYSVEVMYTYDLNDGFGDQSIIFKSGVETIIYQTPVVEISNEQSTQDTITFDLTVTDNDSVGEITAIELYQGETLIESLADLAMREFTGLLGNTVYSVEIIYTYDLHDGLGEQTKTFVSGVETTMYQTPVVNISNEQSTQDTITFELTVTDTENLGEITAIELYQGETLIESLADLSVREFTGLLSNTEYTIQTTYSYDPINGNGVIDMVDVFGFDKFSVKEVVQAGLTNGTVYGYVYSFPSDSEAYFYIEYDSFEWYVSANYVDFGLEIGDLIIFDFTTDYASLFVVGGTFEIVDDLNNNYLTKSKAVPQVSIEPSNIDRNSLGINIFVEDPDLTEDNISIYIYLGASEEQVALNTLTPEFDNLLSNTEYLISVIYSYDLNDGSGVKTIIQELYLYTLPSPIQLSSIVIYEDIADVDSSVTMMIETINPHDIIVDSIVINGVRYNDVSTGLSDQLIVEFNVGNTIGVEQFEVTEITGSIGERQFVYSFTDMSDSIQVIGEFSIQNITSNGNLDYFADYNSIVEFVIELNNPNDYLVEQFTFNDQLYTDTDFTIDTNGNIRIDIQIVQGTNGTLYDFDLTDITYSGTDFTKNIETDIVHTIYLGLISNVVSVFTVEDLLLITDNSSIILEQNIDLNGVDWTPIDCSGCYINGNGYTLSNLTITETMTSELQSYWGMFGVFEDGLIVGLLIDNADITIQNLINGDVTAGVLVGKNRGVILHSYVSGEIIVAQASVNNYEDPIAGGLVGYNYGTIINTHSDVTVTAINNSAMASHVGNSFAGGLIGINRGTVIDSSSTGNVSATAKSTNDYSRAHAGGLIAYNFGDVFTSYSTSTVSGYTENNSSSVVGGFIAFNEGNVYNCYFNGEVNAINGYETFTGGFVGLNTGITDKTYSISEIYVSGFFQARIGGHTGINEGANGPGEISNSFSSSTVNTESVANSSIGGIVGYRDRDLLSNCFVSSITIAHNGVDEIELVDLDYEEVSILPISNLDDEMWYQDILSFDLEVWDFLVLDFQNNLLPKLK